MKDRVIILSSRNIMSLVIARSLGEKGIEVIGADCISLTMLSMSKYTLANETYVDYTEDEDQFLDDVDTIIDKYQPNDGANYVLIPVFKETSLIAKNKKRFEDRITVACTDYSILNHIFPKDTFARTAKKLGVNIPKTIMPKSIEELSSCVEKLNFPVITKPYDASGGKGINSSDNYKDLQINFKKTYEEFDSPPLIQDTVQGDDYCFTALLDEGELIASMAYINLHRYPEEGGSGIMRETVETKPFIKEAMKLLKPLKWTGVAQIDLMWNGENNTQPVVIEINPRYWAGLFHSVQSGIDFPYLQYLLYTGQKLPDIPQAKVGLKTKLPFVWVNSIIKNSINLSAFFNQLGKSKENFIREIKNDTDFLDALKNSLNIIAKEKPVNTEALIKGWQEARNAESEILSPEDPAAALGMTYGLFYLAKYGKLPQEVNI